MFILNYDNFLCFFSFSTKIDTSKFGKILKSSELKEFKVIENRMDETVAHIIKDMTLNSFKNCKTILEVCKKIKNSVSQIFGGTWQCMAYNLAGRLCCHTWKRRIRLFFNIWFKFYNFATSWKSLIISYKIFEEKFLMLCSH